MRTIALVILIGVLPACASVPPATGTGQINGDGLDHNYLIVSDSTGEISKNGVLNAPVPALVVPDNKAGGGWAGVGAIPGTGGLWIGPAIDQTNGTRGTCCGGDTQYQLKFNLGVFTSARLFMSIAADDTVAVTLNGASVTIPAKTNYYQTPATVSLCAFQCQGTLAPGSNTLVFTVHNNNGPTGLNVAFQGTLGDPSFPAAGKSSAPGRYHLDLVDEPVDGATGQYYDTFNDLALGGPLNFGFSRHYSSALSATGLGSTLGTNWMSNFDTALAVSGSTAKVLLFGGSIVQFTNPGSAWQLQSPSDAQYQLVASGTSYKFLDPGPGRIYTFSASGKLTRIEDRNGNAITMTAGLDGPASASDGVGRTLTFTYTNGALTTVKDQGGRTYTYAYNGALLVSATDPYGNTTKYNYTNSGSFTGLMTSRQTPSGKKPTTQSYDASGRVVSQTDGNNNTTQLAYDGSGGSTATFPDGSIIKQVNDANGNLTGLTDPSGASAVVTFNSTGQRVSVTDNAGNKTSFTYDAASGQVATMTDALGNKTSYTYSAQQQGGFTFYNLTGVSYPDGTSSSMSYDADGNLLSLTARDGSVTSYTYDTAGNFLTITAPGNIASKFTWNADGTLASKTDSAGNPTTYGYDALKRVTKITDPEGGVTGFIIDAAGQQMVATTGQVAGESVSTYYDADGNVQTVVNGVGGTTNYAYTNTGQVASITDPLGNKLSYTYDSGTASLPSPMLRALRRPLRTTPTAG